MKPQFLFSFLRSLSIWLIILGLILVGFNPLRQSLAQPNPTPTQPTAIPAPFGRGQVTANSLNIRTGPHVSYTAAAFLMAGEQVRLIGRNRTATWFQIELYNGFKGWVNARYLLPNVHITALPVKDVDLLGITAFVTNDPIMVYAGPGQLHVPVGIAQPGYVLVLNARNDTATWLHTYLPNGQAGWIAADSGYLPATTVNNLPIIAPFTDTAPPFVSAYYLVYRGPGFLFEPVYRVDEGQNLDILGRTTDGRWLNIRLDDGRTGWVSAEILVLSSALAAIPIISDVIGAQVAGWEANLGITGDSGQPEPGPGSSTATPQPSTTPTVTATATPTTTVGATDTGGATGTPTATPRPSRTPMPEVTGTPMTAGVPVYSEPDEDADIIEVLIDGQAVVLIGRTADSLWLRIAVDEVVEGWVRTADVNLGIDIEAVPVIGP